ncbi:MAG: hypothetical protein Q9160_001798 [Pyrenula sp. 1 TL-2023]
MLEDGEPVGSHNVAFEDKDVNVGSGIGTVGRGKIGTVVKGTVKTIELVFGNRGNPVAATVGEPIMGPVKATPDAVVIKLVGAAVGVSPVMDAMPVNEFPNVHTNFCSARESMPSADRAVKSIVRQNIAGSSVPKKLPASSKANRAEIKEVMDCAPVISI